MESGSATTAQVPSAEDGRSPAAETFEVENPADGSVIATLEVDGPERVRDVVAEVRAAQPEWEALGVPGRYRWLGRWRDWLLDNADDLVDLFQEETGKVRADAELELPLMAALVNYYGENGERFLADEHPRAHLTPFRAKKLAIRYRPYGVAGFIVPWNFPLILGFCDAIPALTAGCAAVIKPSEFTPLTTMELVRGWREEVGAPDVFRIVNGMGETGGALVDEVDFIQFTGSDRTGKLVMKRAAETLTPVSLELGGKDPMIVLDDANLERAVNGAAMGGFFNSGQACLSIERVYVEEPIYDEFVAKLQRRVESLRQGTDARGEYNRDVGAMISPEQRAKVERHVADAREKGARVLTGGKPKEGPGDYYEPTLLADCDHTMEAMRDETFGPTIAVMKVRDEQEALELANDTRYGLGAAVFSGDPERADRVARRIEAGGVNVNDSMVHFGIADLPMGGWKESGIGYRHGEYGIRKYCRVGSITTTRFPRPATELLWAPHTKRKASIARRTLQFFARRGARSKLASWRR